jgi:hypothetical protein
MWRMGCRLGVEDGLGGDDGRMNGTAVPVVCLVPLEGPAWGISSYDGDWDSEKLDRDSES